MLITFTLGDDYSILEIERESFDPRPKASGYTRHTHGWGEEIHLLHLLKTALNGAGFNLASVHMHRDGHMMGDDYMRYLRPPRKALAKNMTFPSLYIYDEKYAVRSSAEAFINGEEVEFAVCGNPFPDFPQPDWKERVEQICSPQPSFKCTIVPPVLQ